MSRTRDAVTVRQASSTALLIPPPKRAKVYTVPSDSSSFTDGSEFSDSSVTDDNLRHDKRHPNDLKYPETNFVHPDDGNENSLLDFPVPQSYQTYISSPAFYKKSLHLEEMQESRSISLAGYRLEEREMRRVPDIIFTESGSDLQSSVEAHEKEHLKYAPHHKRVKLDILRELSRSISDFEAVSAIKKEQQAVIQQCLNDFNPQVPRRLPNSRDSMSKTTLEQPIFPSKPPIENKKLSKAVSEIKTDKNRLRESSSLDSKKGSPSSWHSYFTGKINFNFRNKHSKQEALLEEARNNSASSDKSASVNATEIKNNTSVMDIDRVRLVASYWNFTPMLEKSLRIHEKVMTGYGDASKRTRKSNQSSQKMRLMKSGVPTRRPSWFQKILVFLRIRPDSGNKNSPWKPGANINMQAEAETQKHIKFDIKKAVKSKLSLKSLGSRTLKTQNLPHKDSKVILRERRQKLFEETQEFYEDSVMAYRNSFKPKPVPDILQEITDDKLTAIPLPPTALILSSLANTAKPSTLTTIARFPHVGKSFVTYSSVSETALLPIMKVRRSLLTVNESPTITTPEIEVKEEANLDGTVRGILKKPK